MKNRILYRHLKTNRYLCTIIQNKMGINKLKVVLTEEAQAFWDTEEETLVIATHGIVKKTQKTPLKEIAKAEEIRKEYFNNLLAELKNRLKISIFLWRKKLCISLIFSNFVVSNYKVIYFTLCTTCMQIS